jgi:hypothetical protein
MVLGFAAVIRARVGAAVDDAGSWRALNAIVERTVLAGFGPEELLIVGICFGGYLGFEEVELGLAEENAGMLEGLRGGREIEKNQK